MMDKFNTKGKYISKFGVYEYEVFVDHEIGGFEIWQEHDRAWIEGGKLWFENDKLVEYDGVWTLNKAIIDCLERNGFDVAEMKDSLHDEW